jgi:hypothetical protein
MGINWPYNMDGGRAWNLLDRRMPLHAKAIGDLSCIPESSILALE